MALRWTLMVVVVIASFVVAGFVGAFVAEALGLWFVPSIGFIAAFAVVLATYLSAPTRKLTSALVAMLVGAVVAWLLAQPSYFPASYGEGLAYEPTYLPIVVTYVGGLLGLLVSTLLHRWVGPNSSIKPTPLRGAAYFRC
jgi:hypothetical protein